MSTSSEYDFAGHDERVREHYDHAREKHPFFCDIITCLSDVGSDTHLDIYRATLRAESENEAVEAGTLLGCEFYEAIQAYTHGDTAHAVEKLYDAIAVLLRTIDVLEGRQILGRPETISGNSAGIKEKGTNDNEKDNIQDDLHLQQVQEGAGDPLRREGQRRKTSIPQV